MAWLHRDGGSRSSDGSGESRRTHRWAIVRSYACDWLALFVLVVVALVFTTKINTMTRLFRLDDPSIAAPLIVETVPAWLMAVLGVLLPFVVQIGVAVATRRTFIDFHNSTLGLGLSLTLTLLVTFLAKNIMGLLRPNFLARCQPSTDPAVMQAAAVTIGQIVWYNETICTGDHDIIMEGRRSFFSGHTSLSFAGLGFLSLYLCGKLHVFDRTGRVCRLALGIWPIVLAIYIGLSRLHDQWHFWHDVLVGMLVGMSFAYLSYHYYFPSLHDPCCAEPYIHRVSALAPQAAISNQSRLFPRKVRRSHQDATLDGVRLYAQDHHTHMPSHGQFQQSRSQSHSHHHHHGLARHRGGSDSEAARLDHAAVHGDLRARCCACTCSPRSPTLVASSASYAEDDEARLPSMQDDMKRSKRSSASVPVALASVVTHDATVASGPPSRALPSDEASRDGDLAPQAAASQARGLRYTHDQADP
ncbi:hypothetical protein CXG81DRAFT_25073 [Caulochytrium protostelioides]|uniref:Phosphatidic acid phosphatase type 2/haloperoxidase domain-containing protein n=1 Tax=Caulochytrium protostelioides TaxID=1555241 RepID=A0A4P9XAA1_9FUNG|nr:hypothetical protein CXG81DRAFT_25073 [Caulochytrium protostelioides]|eukprot:RKP02293.1 hypothetical protein CXG81DRAFT_25073 [Caulochytrium protostelioides]